MILVRKNGIIREIDEHKLPSYQEDGYEKVIIKNGKEAIKPKVSDIIAEKNAEIEALKQALAEKDAKSKEKTKKTDPKTPAGEKTPEGAEGAE